VVKEAVAFSPDGRTVLTVGAFTKAARLWDTATGKELHTLRHRGTVDAVAFSRDGGILLTGSRDNTARLWDTATGKELHALRHESWVHTVAFSPDGRTIPTGSHKAARLWDTTLTPVPDEPPPMKRLRAWVGFRTGKAFNEEGALRNLSFAEWQQRWKDLEAHGGDWEKPPDPRHWHRAQATEAEAAKHWFGAAFHLTRLLLSDRDNVDLLRRRARAYAEMEKWPEALADWAKVIQRHPDDTEALKGRDLARKKAKK
jgi:hypothetical protein